MSHSERIAWDSRFREGSHSGEQPDPFLLRLEDYKDLLPAGRRALDVACGAGRHAVWLAQNGWNVTACDFSLAGLRRARELAAERGVDLSLCAQELETALFPDSHFELVICFFYLQRELFPVLKATLRPGGLIVLKTYTTDQAKFSGGPSHPLHLLRPQELLRTFLDFRMLCYEETIRGRGVAGLIAQKP